MTIFSCLTLSFFLLPVIAMAQENLPDWVDVPVGIDLTVRRQELFELAPTLISPITSSSLRQLGNDISKFETNVIRGFRDEILGVCRETKAFEANINRPSIRANLSDDLFGYYVDHISSLRDECDTKNVSTSRYWALEADLRALNSDIFRVLQIEGTRCAQRPSCFNK